MATTAFDIGLQILRRQTDIRLTSEAEEYLRLSHEEGSPSGITTPRLVLAAFRYGETSASSQMMRNLPVVAGAGNLGKLRAKAAATDLSPEITADTDDQPFISPQAKSVLLSAWGTKRGAKSKLEPDDIIYSLLQSRPESCNLLKIDSRDFWEMMDDWCYRAAQPVLTPDSEGSKQTSRQDPAIDFQEYSEAFELVASFERPQILRFAQSLGFDAKNFRTQTQPREFAAELIRLAKEYDLSAAKVKDAANRFVLRRPEITNGTEDPDSSGVLPATDRSSNFPKSLEDWRQYLRERYEVTFSETATKLIQDAADKVGQVGSRDLSLVTTKDFVGPMVRKDGILHGIKLSQFFSGSAGTPQWNEDSSQRDLESSAASSKGFPNFSNEVEAALIKADELARVADNASEVTDCEADPEIRARS